MSDESVPPIIIDNGTGAVKVGFGGEDNPRLSVPSCIGRPKNPASTTHGAGLEEFYIGSEAQSKRDVLALQFPIERGFITNFDDMEKIWRFCFQSLQISPEERLLFHTEPVLNPKPDREKLTQIMF
eukprot:TRINITY_DN5360_c0_g1_i1.p1 TRINITY_DN5360_c0_g1~~TRINITY_DN5360_c0_g1_i1.p1  ORF type:complete len:126 (+),score=19.77 TRINITY_DN5360_c0_g1_i1:119-496(+)